MAKPAKLGPSLCPDCYLTQGIDTPLISRPGSILRCELGHSWQGNDHYSDMEILEQRQSMARHKRNELAKQANPPEQEATVSAIVQANDTDIVIGKEDQNRITSIIGEFSDSSSLFGSIFALQQDLRAAQDELQLARKHAASSANKTNGTPEPQMMSSGDMKVVVTVPERFVQGLKDISEANSTTPEAYMDAVIANGFDGGWFF